MIAGSIAACPWLPEIDRDYDYTLTRRHGMERGDAFYMDALRYAQSQWMAGKPAQALLQIDKALMADLSDGDAWLEGVDPYRAMVWIMIAGSAEDSGFLGNPVRHFQHLASRMSGVRAEVRSWRAWACLHLAERYLAGSQCPRDGVQLVREGLWIPSASAAVGGLAKVGWLGEAQLVEALLAGN